MAVSLARTSSDENGSDNWIGNDECCQAEMATSRYAGARDKLVSLRRARSPERPAEPCAGSGGPSSRGAGLPRSADSSQKNLTPVRATSRQMQNSAIHWLHGCVERLGLK